MEKETRIFSRQRLSVEPVTSNSPSPAGSRSRANSVDMKEFQAQLDEYIKNGGTFNTK